MSEGLIVYQVYEQDEAYKYGVHTSYKAIKLRATYDELVEVLGQPTFPMPNEDESVHRSWVCRWNSSTYEIYDYNTFSEEYTINFLRSWYINTDSEGDVLEFSKMVEGLIKNRNLKTKKEWD